MSQYTKLSHLTHFLSVRWHTGTQVTQFSPRCVISRTKSESNNSVLRTDSLPCFLCIVTHQKDEACGTSTSCTISMRFLFSFVTGFQTIEAYSRCGVTRVWYSSFTDLEQLKVPSDEIENYGCFFRSVFSLLYIPLETVLNMYSKVLMTCNFFKFLSHRFKYIFLSPLGHGFLFLETLLMWHYIWKH